MGYNFQTKVKIEKVKIMNFDNNDTQVANTNVFRFLSKTSDFELDYNSRNIFNNCLKGHNMNKKVLN